MRRYPARQITIPEGFVVSDEEIVAVLTAADERKRNGDPIIAVETPEGYTIIVPKAAPISHEEAVRFLFLLNEAKQNGNADVLITFQDGQIVKDWITLKNAAARKDGKPNLIVGGNRMPKDF